MCVTFNLYLQADKLKCLIALMCADTPAAQIELSSRADAVIDNLLKTDSTCTSPARIKTFWDKKGQSK